MIPIINQSLLEANTKYIAHQCNCITSHSAGIAKAIFDKYPYANTYKDRMYTGYNFPGRIDVLGNGEDSRFIINMYVQFWPGKPGKDIYDTWFQTETGSIMIANRPGLEVRPGSMGRPLSYIDAAILNDKGKPLPPLEKGLLCIKKPWSSMFVEYMNDLRTYHDKFMGEFYSSGDVAFSDHDGYYWFIGRNDDVINTAGHLVSPFEVESALLEMDEVTDVGVVGVPDDVLYEKIVAFVVKNNKKTDERQTELKMKLHVSNKVSSMAAPKEIIFVDSVPKTKSGKIMRRVLRNRYLNLDLGDLSTLEEY